MAFLLEISAVRANIVGMSTAYFFQIVAAVIVANGLCFAFFMGAMKCSQLQKEGVGDDELPLWVYACLVVPPLFVALGGYLLNGSGAS